MADKYTGTEMDRHYSGEDGDIAYNLKRCIHAKRCVLHLSQVFDPGKRPWIDPNAANKDEIHRFMPNCPSGALHFIPKDGATEPIPEENTVRLWADGPVQFHGDLRIEGATVDIDKETRVTFCRCGASNNKPFCDNSHKAIGFKADDPAEPVTTTELEERGGKLVITAEVDGALHIEGNFKIVNAAGVTIAAGDDTWLCRCGASNNKPFCDSSHIRIGFQGE